MCCLATSLAQWLPQQSSNFIDRMYRSFPQVKLLALLRDPVARARSEYAMKVGSVKKWEGGGIKEEEAK